MRSLPMVVLAFLVAPLAVARAGEGKKPLESLLAQAKAAEESDPTKAAGLYGQAVATGHKMSLLVEQEAADAFETFLDRLDRKARPPPGEPRSGAAPGVRDALAAVLHALDPKRHGAFVSAHALASEILADACAVGDGAHVDEAAAALSAYASTPKAGRAAAALAHWADGMRAARSRDAAKADAALATAAKSFAENGFLAQAIGAATELAAVRWASKDVAKTAEALAIAAGIVKEESDAGVVREWIGTVKRRLPDAPPEALAAYAAATAPFEGKASAGAAGGRGGNGGSPGGDVSALGRVFPKWSVDKAIVRATRTAAGLVVRTAYAEADTAAQALGAGQKTWDDGGDGVTLVFAGPAVALRLLDLKGTEGGPGERSRASRGRAFYLLAVGETWSAAKSGVTIGP